MISCIFCKIAAHEIGSEIVFEDAETIGFLDIEPLFPGHVLLVPKTHYETLVDLEERLVAPLFQNARVLARAVEKGLGCDGTFVAINNRISQSVPHLHVHIVPRRKKDGLKGFFWPRRPYTGEDHTKEVGRAIRDAIAQDK